MVSSYDKCDREENVKYLRESIYIYRNKVWMLYYDCNGVRYIGKVEGASSYRKDRLYYKLIMILYGYN